MKQLTGFAALILYSIISWAGSGNAAQESFEINLKELRPAPAGTTKTQQKGTRRSEGTKTQTLPETGKATESSFYTVRPGDHLFVILMRNYNLSNQAAERLIPEVQRLNGISNPQGLTVGQRLTIPLPSPRERQSRAARKQLPQAESAAPQSATPAAPQAAQPQVPVPAPQIPPQQSVQKQPDATTAAREVSISAVSSCILAHNLAKQLGLLAPSTKLIPGKDTLTAENAGLKVVVTCGLSSDQAYTYERLLAQHGIQLLALTGTESGKHVIRKLANHLSLSYRQIDSDAAGNPASSYLFPAIGPDGRDIRINIVP